MMYILVILALTLLLFVSFKIEKHILSPSTIFSIEWLFIFSLAILMRKQFYGISDLTCIIILLGTNCFCIASLISSRVKIKSENNYIRTEIDLKRYYIFIMLALISSLGNVINAVNMVISGNSIYSIYVSVINAHNGYNSEMALSRFWAILQTFIADPLVRLIIPVSIFLFFEKKKYRYLIISLLFTTNLVITTGGRINIVLYAIYLLIALCYYKNSGMEMIKKVNKKIKILVSLLIVVFIYITIQRGGNLISAITKYLAGCIPHMSMRLEKLGIEKFGGLSSLQGFYRPIFSLLDQIGILSEPELISKVYEISDTESAVYIGDNYRFNSFITPFYNFYIDAGLLGVIIGSLILGIVAGQLYRKAMRNNASLKDTAIFALFMGQTIVLSFMRFSFIRINYAWAFVYAIFLFKKKTQKLP